MTNNWRALISQPQYGIREDKNVFVTMRDGICLAVDVFRPDAPDRFPALLAIGGYGKDAAVQQRLDAAVEAGYGEKSIQAVILPLEKETGVKVRTSK
jgi:predicted acyl esterase